MVFTVVMYGCESWTVKKAEHQRNDAFELCPQQNGQGTSHSPTGPWAPTEPLMENTVTAK